MFGHSQIKYSIPIQAKQPDKKCIVLLFLIKNFKKDRKSSLSDHNFSVVLSEFS